MIRIARGSGPFLMMSVAAGGLGLLILAMGYALVNRLMRVLDSGDQAALVGAAATVESVVRGDGAPHRAAHEAETPGFTFEFAAVPESHPQAEADATADAAAEGPSNDAVVATPLLQMVSSAPVIVPEEVFSPAPDVRVSAPPAWTMTREESADGAPFVLLDSPNGAQVTIELYRARGWSAQRELDESVALLSDVSTSERFIEWGAFEGFGADAIRRPMLGDGSTVGPRERVRVFVARPSRGWMLEVTESAPLMAWRVAEPAMAQIRAGLRVEQAEERP